MVLGLGAGLYYQTFERAKTVLSDQQHSTVSVLLPVVTGLQRGLTDLPDLHQNDNSPIKTFWWILSDELRTRFAFSRTSASALASVVDPQFRGLSFVIRC